MIVHAENHARYNLFPDEKGTESDNVSEERQFRFSYNLFPDEKGTESLYIIAFQYNAPSYNLFPDEKGTERRNVMIRTKQIPSLLLCLLMPLLLLDCGRSCDPYRAWVNKYGIFSINGNQIEPQFEDMVNPPHLTDYIDRLYNGNTIPYVYWDITFKSNNIWHSNLYIIGTVPGLVHGISDTVVSTIDFSGTYYVAGNTYELNVLNVQNNTPFDVSRFVEFVKDQNFGTYQTDRGICDISPRLVKFGVFRLNHYTNLRPNVESTIPSAPSFPQ